MGGAAKMVTVRSLFAGNHLQLAPLGLRRRRQACPAPSLTFSQCFACSLDLFRYLLSRFLMKIEENFYSSSSVLNLPPFLQLRKQRGACNVDRKSLHAFSPLFPFTGAVFEAGLTRRQLKSRLEIQSRPFLALPSQQVEPKQQEREARWELEKIVNSARKKPTSATITESTALRRQERSAVSDTATSTRLFKGRRGKKRWAHALRESGSDWAKDWKGKKKTRKSR